MASNKLSDMNLDGVVAKHRKDVPAKELACHGFSTRLLWTGENGRKALMFEIAPGAVYPDLDVHAPGAEEVFVVSGNFCDGKNSYPAGTFIHHPAGTSHIPQSSDGCVLFVFFPEG
ncbi:MAG TPA: cupin domain-containing protein [Gallionella sp.]|nr:cupin domain-containing protein [Gallionella sp.]